MRITITDDTLRLKGVPNFPDALELILASIAQLADQIIQKYEGEKQDEIRGDMFDMINKACGNLLDYIAPNNYEAYPDFTATALRYVEDIYLQHLYDELDPEDQQTRKEQLEAFLKNKRDELCKGETHYES